MTIDLLINNAGGAATGSGRPVTAARGAGGDFAATLARARADAGADTNIATQQLAQHARRPAQAPAPQAGAEAAPGQSGTHPMPMPGNTSDTMAADGDLPAAAPTPPLAVAEAGGSFQSEAFHAEAPKEMLHEEHFLAAQAPPSASGEADAALAAAPPPDELALIAGTSGDQGADETRSDENPETLDADRQGLNGQNPAELPVSALPLAAATAASSAETPSSAPAAAVNIDHDALRDLPQTTGNGRDDILSPAVAANTPVLPSPTNGSPTNGQPSGSLPATASGPPQSNQAAALSTAAPLARQSMDPGGNLDGGAFEGEGQGNPGEENARALPLKATGSQSTGVAEAERPLTSAAGSSGGSSGTPTQGSSGIVNSGTPTQWSSGTPGPLQHTSLASPHWGLALGGEVARLVQRGEQQVSLQLTPAELGPLLIDLKLSDQQAQLQLLSATPQVRAALEQALPLLRDALAAQGISLGETHIGDQGRGEPQPDQRQHGHARNGTEPLAEEAIAVRQQPLAASGGVDLFV